MQVYKNDDTLKETRFKIQSTKQSISVDKLKKFKAFNLPTNKNMFISYASLIKYAQS